MTDGRRTLGLWRNLWRYFTKVKPNQKMAVKEFVGEDKMGNKYFLTPKDKSMTGKEAREIEPSDRVIKKHDFITNYGMEMEIPVEWNYKSMTGKEAREIEPSDRVIKKHDFITNYGMEMEIPVEWNSWLRGLRKDPPTPEEIERNEFKKLRLAERVRILEMKEAEEKQKMRNEFKKLRLAERVRILEMKEAEEKQKMLGEEGEDQPDRSDHVTSDVQPSLNPKKVPFPKYGDTFEPLPGVTKKKEPND